MIGRLTLDVIRSHPGRFNVRALAAYSNVDLLAEQARAFKPEYVCIVDESKHSQLTEAMAGTDIRVLAGDKDMVDLAALGQVDTVVNAVVGAAGLKASLAAVRNGKALALANKESLVAGGPLFPDLVKKSNSLILPIDSEHSAIWQALMSGRKEEVRNLIITASGGPFRAWPKEKFASITPEQALNHPTWKMGPKITIDSATLFNKGLEVIEAVALFQVPPDQVKVVIHPQSIVHSMVEFIDSSILAQLSNPDMRLPIAYALFWPERVESDFGRLELSQLSELTFEMPDLERFPALRLAYEVAREGGTAPAVFNAANEVAVESFLNKSIGFADITGVVGQVMDKIEVVLKPNLGDILEADRSAREMATIMIGKLAC